MTTLPPADPQLTEQFRASIKANQNIMPERPVPTVRRYVTVGEMKNNVSTAIMLWTVAAVSIVAARFFAGKLDAYTIGSIGENGAVTVSLTSALMFLGIIVLALLTIAAIGYWVVEGMRFAARFVGQVKFARQGTFEKSEDGRRKENRWMVREPRRA